MASPLSLRADRAAMVDMGLCSHVLRYTDHAAACDEIIASGVRSVRIGVEWSSLQPTSAALPGGADPTLLARLDAVVSRLRADSLGDRKVEILFILGLGADWCSTAPAGTSSRRFYPPTPTVGLDAWAAFVTFLANRYDNRITHWEVWNEQDSSTFLRLYTPPGGSPAYVDVVDAYHAILSRAYDALKAVNPANNVLLGGLVMPPTNPRDSDPDAPDMQVDFLDQLLSRGAGAKFDIMNIHAYGDAVTQRAKYLSLQTVLAKHGLQNLRVWLTETGYTTYGDSSLEPMKADRLTQHWLNHMSYPNLERIFWYVDRNIISNSTDPQHRLSEENRGLRHTDRTPLLPWYHYQALDGAFVDFERQTMYPSLVPTQNTVYYSGTGITNHNASGSEKLIPVGGYMYFHVNDQWIHDANGGIDDTVYVEFEYLNSPQGAGLRLDYDAKGSATSTQLPVVTRGVARGPLGSWIKHTFTIPNAGFTNSTNGVADFRLYAGGAAALAVRDVVVRRRTDAARIKLGPVDRFFLMDRQHSDASGDSHYNPSLADFNGEPCRQIPADKFMIFRVSDAFIRTGDTRLQLNIRFWDDAGGNIVLQYNASNGSTTQTRNIAKTGTNAWRTATVEIADADFRNASSWGTDFRLSSGSDDSTEHVSYLEVMPLPFLTDDFQDGDSAGWTLTGGSWTVTDESGARALRQNTSSGETRAVAGVNTWSDFEYSADLTLHNDGSAGLIARYTNSSNYYLFSVSAGLDRLSVKKRVAGVTTTLVDLPRDLSTDTPYRLRFVFNGPWLSAFIDGTQVAYLYDASFATGRIGAHAIDGTFSIDNVDVRKTLRDNAPFAAWRRSWFAAGELGEPSVSGDTADPDDDGLPNRLEFALNLDPLAGDTAPPTFLELIATGAQPQLGLSHRRHRRASDLVFNYETSADLTTWTPFTPAGTTLLPIDAATDEVTVQTPLLEPRQFLRLRVERP